MQGDYVALHVRVRNRPIREFHDKKGRVFVEGRPGSEYDLEVRNATGRRVMVVLSVDGISVNTGKQASLDDVDGQWIDPYEMKRCTGITDGGEVSTFTFAKRKVRNAGVIGCAVVVEPGLGPREVLTLYYDDARGLGKRGVDVRTSRVRPLGNPFPASGCTPPKGWQA